jgi:hypothetical protein
MKSSLLILLLLLFSISTYPQGGTHVPGPDLNVARVGATGFTLNDGRVVILGGRGTGFVKLNTAEIYNPASNSFNLLTMNDYRDMASVVKLSNGKFLIIGGCSSDLGVGQLNTMETFDPSNNTFVPTANMLYNRTWARGVQLASGKVLIAGCWWDNAVSMKADLFDPAANTTTAAGDVLTAVSNPFIIPMYDGSALMIGGNSPFGGAAYERIEKYDPGTNSFSTFSTALLPNETGYTPYYGLGDTYECFRMNNNKIIMLAGKSEGANYKYKLFTIDPASTSIDTFYTNPPLPVYNISSGDSLSYLCAILNKSDNLLYLVSIINEHLNAAYRVAVVNLTTHAFINPTGVTRVPYYFHDTQRYYLDSGKLFFAGGSLTDNFDPVKNTFFINNLLTDVNENEPVPQEFSLLQNYPNPFNPVTTISFNTPERTKVSLSVYNSLGQIVAVPFSGLSEKGKNEVIFNAAGLSSGIYIYVLKTGINTGKMLSGKMIYLK